MADLRLQTAASVGSSTILLCAMVSVKRVRRGTGATKDKGKRRAGDRPNDREDGNAMKSSTSEIRARVCGLKQLALETW